ncbi:hypothetical protein HORIV_47370 [Vreelandella olivaria]|uniref:ABC transmembrane type-1 domain-containing protein n=1 Tax=Vreelandella olivaria TaxID=390919 RepID=A0ABM7GNH3_9GAMM|nr:hypothetical protein HORIV_47370 [Halomonas olivaria]
MLYTIPGLIIADVMLALPYVITAVTAGLHGFDQTQEMVARSLGMNRFRSFMSVTLPQIMPSVVTGAIFAFIQALDETMVALFISGGQNQPPDRTHVHCTARRNRPDHCRYQHLINSRFLRAGITTSTGSQAVTGVKTSSGSLSPLI